MKATFFLALFVPFLLVGVANAGAPAAPQDCIDLDENCDSDSTTLATYCGTGSYAAPRKSSNVTVGPGVTSVTLVQCGTGATTVITSYTDFCTDLPSGWNDNVCEVDVVTDSTCPASPTTGCTTSGGASLSIKDSTTNRKDKLTWKWSHGPTLTQSAFGDPTSSTSYDLCVYSDGALKASAYIPAGSSWQAVKSTGYKYKDKASSYGGISAVALAGGDTSKIAVKAKGIALPSPASASTFFDAASSLQVQLVASGMCFESTFDATAIVKNKVDGFSAKY